MEQVEAGLASEDGPIRARCDCGEVTVTLARLPERINACPCDYCRRVGARWGYLPAEDVRIEGVTIPYRRMRKEIEFRRCELCGVVTHWQWPGRPAGRNVGVNMANVQPGALLDVPVVVEP